MASSMIDAVKSKLNIGHANGINGHTTANGHAVHGAGVALIAEPDHPLDPLTEAEISAVGLSIRKHFSEVRLVFGKFPWVLTVLRRPATRLSRLCTSA